MWIKLSLVILLMGLIVSINAKDQDFFHSESIDNKMSTQVWDIHYRNVNQLLKSLAPKKLLSKNGNIRTDVTANRIWVNDDAVHLQKINSLIHEFDTPIKQIQITAEIINIDNNYSRTLGTSINQIIHTDDNSHSNQGALQIAVTSINHLALDYRIEALLKEGHAKLIAKPKLLTQNRHQAIIEAGSEIPYQEKTGTGNTSVAFKKAVLRLAVTPTILPHHDILLNININQDQVSTLTVNGVPAIKTQRLLTQGVVHNQHTLILGGVDQSNQSRSKSSIPIIHHIPIIGWLLSHHNHTHDNHQLLIFIRPSIIGP